MRFIPRAFIALALCPILVAQLHAADNWPQWRGPNSKGIAAEGDYPVKFSADEGVAWKVELPGPGCSSPTVWGDAIFLTSIIDGQDGVCRYDFDGKKLWEKKLGPGKEGKSPHGSGSNPTPATDGKHVVTYFKSGRVACHDFDGHQLWQLNLQHREGALWWDLGTSPVLVSGNAVIAVMQEGDSYLVALDVETGDVAWKQKRQYKRPEESDQAYTTPQTANIDGREVIVTWGADHLTGHDAKTGEPLWDSGGFNPKNEGMWRVIASQAMGDGIAVVPYGRGKFLAGVKLGGQGDVTEKNRLWDKYGDVGADCPTPIVDGDKVYVLGDQGKVTCRDLKTGNEIWSGQLPRSRVKYFASPILAGGKLYCAREDGMLFVVGAGDEFKLLSENEMGERIIATPVPMRNGLIIRGEKHLFRIDGDGASVAAATGS